ncbi:MAG: hypothetical protein H7Y04_05830 [Verrucomicrobia bacterium]|nr:hypothetical protein [Cytophagales bacterium]
MKNLTLIVVALVLFIAACRSITSHRISSITYIEPNKSFELGKGKHGAYTADVKNAGNTEVEVITETIEGVQTSLGTLKPQQKNVYFVEKDTKVYFKNMGIKNATLDLWLKGESGLSMGYQDTIKK